MDLQACNSIMVFGGTFDPPHVAHVALPMQAMRAIGADAVAYVPAAVSPFKQGQHAAPAEDRLAMLRLALAEQPRAAIVTDELDRAGASGGEPSYTVDTLQALRRRLGDKVTLRLLIGADQMRQLDQWKSPQRIVELAEPLVMLRPPQTLASLLASLPAGYDPKVWAPRVIELPLMDVSATDIRRRVAAGEPITGLVAPAVERYIHEHGLYQ